MSQETKTCEKCNKNFEILADDVLFYEKLDLPLPTMCPYCRWKYLLAFWVFGRFRITNSALSGKRIITVIPESAPFPIYDRVEFVSDAWDPFTYGKDYDLHVLLWNNLWSFNRKCHTLIMLVQRMSIAIGQMIGGSRKIVTYVVLVLITKMQVTLIAYRELRILLTRPFAMIWINHTTACIALKVII